MLRPYAENYKILLRKIKTNNGEYIKFPQRKTDYENV